MIRNVAPWRLTHVEVQVLLFIVNVFDFLLAILNGERIQLKYETILLVIIVKDVCVCLKSLWKEPSDQSSLAVELEALEEAELEWEEI